MIGVSKLKPEQARALGRLEGRAEIFRAMISKVCGLEVAVTDLEETERQLREFEKEVTDVFSDGK